MDKFIKTCIIVAIISTPIMLLGAVANNRGVCYPALGLFLAGVLGALAGVVLES